MRLSLGLGLPPGGNGVPALDLSFVNGETLDSRITFTRGSAATRVNSAGLIESVSANVPRFNYDPVTLAAKGLLIEEQRTNKQTYSEQFDHTNWTKQRCTITANSAISPDGTQTADTVTATSGNADLYQGPGGGAVGSPVTWSIYVKRKTGTGPIQYWDADSNKIDITETLYTTNWTRIIYTTVSPTNTSNYGGIRIVASGDELYVWGGQIEAGSFATSYIPTTTVQMTRSADLASMTGASFSNWYNQIEGAFVADFDTFAPTTQGYVYCAIQDGNNFMGPEKQISGNLEEEVWLAGVAQARITSVATLVAGMIYRDAFAYKVNDFARSLNAANVQVDTAGALVSPIALNFGRYSSGEYLNGHIRAIRYYRTRLADATLRSMTA